MALFIIENVHQFIGHCLISSDLCRELLFAIYAKSGYFSDIEEIPKVFIVRRGHEIITGRF